MNATNTLRLYQSIGLGSVTFPQIASMLIVISLMPSIPNLARMACFTIAAALDLWVLFLLVLLLVLSLGYHFRRVEIIS